MHPHPCFSIRALSLQDLDLLANYERENFFNPWSKTMLAEQISSSCRVVNLGLVFDHDASRVIAYILGRGTDDEAELEKIAVHTSYQRKGLGMQLLKAWISTLNATVPLQKIFLEVRERDERARAFYRQMGFEEIGYRAEYYRNSRGMTEGAITCLGKVPQIWAILSSRLGTYPPIRAQK